MIRRIRQTALKEWKGVIKFLIVGGLSFFIYAGIYDGFAIVPIAGICACYTYFTHRLFTFRKPQNDTIVL